MIYRYPIRHQGILTRPYHSMYHRIFNKIQTVAKTDLKYLARGSFWLLSNYVVTTILTFLLAVAFANLLPKDTFGNYRFVLSLAAIIGGFSLSGLHLAVIRDVSRGVHSLLRDSFKTQLRWGLVVLTISLCVSLYYLLKENNALALSLLSVGIFLPIISSSLIYSSFWEGRKNYKKVALYSIITTLVYSGTLFIVIQFTTSVPIIVFFYFATQACCAYLFYRISLKSDTGEKTETQTTINFGKHLSFLNILSTIAAQLDKILIFKYLGAPELAVYVLSQIPLTQTRAIFKQIAQTVYPKYSARTISDIRSTIYHKMFLFTIPLVLVVLVYILLAPHIFNIFFPKYTEAILYSQVAMLSLIFFQKKLIAYAALAHASKKQLYAIAIYPSLLKIILLLILLPQYGIWGAIFTEIIIQILGLFSSLFMLRRFK